MKRYKILDSLYNQVIWRIREYEKDLMYLSYLEKRVGSISAPKLSDLPKSHNRFNSEEELAINIAYLKSRIQIIENALYDIPAQYKFLILDHICRRVNYYDDCFGLVDIKKFKFWKQKFIYEVAIQIDSTYIDIVKKIDEG